MKELIRTSNIYIYQPVLFLVTLAFIRLPSLHPRSSPFFVFSRLFIRRRWSINCNAAWGRYENNCSAEIFTWIFFVENYHSKKRALRWNRYSKMKGTKRASGTFIAIFSTLFIRFCFDMCVHIYIYIDRGSSVRFQGEEVVEANGSFAGANFGGEIEESRVKRTIDGGRWLQGKRLRDCDKRFFFFLFVSISVKKTIDSRFRAESKDRRASKTIGGERNAEDTILEKIEHVEGTNEKRNRDRRTREIHQRSLVAIAQGRVGAS